MKKKKTFIGLALIIAVLVLGVGYAAISNITLTVNGNLAAKANDANFKVLFTQVLPAGKQPDVETIIQSGQVETDPTTATLNVSGLESANSYVKYDLEIENQSNGIAAQLADPTISVTKATDGADGDEEYFDVTYVYKDAESNIVPNPKLNPEDIAILEVTVKLKKTPISTDPKAKVTITFDATPTEVDETMA